MGKQLTLILGGARSGKSAFAERLAMSGGRVLFAATAEAHDDDMKRRIAAHRKARPDTWNTLEEPIELARSMSPITENYDTVLIDCLTLWVSNILLKNESNPELESDATCRARDLLDVYEAQSASWIVVSNEVGLGVVPPYKLGRIYRDALGKVNQMFASRADKVYLMTAGLALELKSLGAKPFGEINVDQA